MSRWIDADALIEAMGEEPYVWNDELEEIAERNQWRTDMNIIESAPSIDIPQWTPCSERLPSEYGRYLVVYPILINKLWVSILWYGKPTFPEKDEPCFYASDDEYGDVEYNDVVAWMPLPKPYEAE